jgi:FG-GAP-like repeat
VAAHLNADNLLDVVVINSLAPVISVLLGRGDGTFEPVRPVETLTRNPAHSAVADFNSDGFADLVITGFDVEATLLLGNGDGTFQGPVLVSSPSEAPRHIATADFNLDGKADFITVAQGVQHVWLGNGDGTFRDGGVTGNFAEYYPRFAVADVDGDALPDLVVTNSHRRDISVHINLGDWEGGAPGGGSGAAEIVQWLASRRNGLAAVL